MFSDNFSEDRRALLAQFYGVSKESIDALALIPYGDHRKNQCWAADIDPYIFRTMVDYTRYPEAILLLSGLRDSLPSPVITNFNVLDFGCLVADYGIYLARRGASVTLHDKVDVLPFATFRFDKENLKVKTVPVPTDILKLIENQDLVVFGEVLEHLKDPFSVLASCKQAKLRYIFTSCYPYGEESYFRLPGHTASSQQQQTICLKLLQSHYQEVPLKNNARLWKLNAI